jgi:hypothetical protein
VTAQLLTQRPVLRRNRSMAIEPAPLGNRPNGPAKMAGSRAAFHHPGPRPRPAPEMAKAQEIERPRLGTLASGRVIGPVRWPKRHQPGLVGVNGQPILAKTLWQHVQHPTRVVRTGEAHDEIVRVALVTSLSPFRSFPGADCGPFLGTNVLLLRPPAPIEAAKTPRPTLCGTVALNLGAAAQATAKQSVALPKLRANPRGTQLGKHRFRRADRGRDDQRPFKSTSIEGAPPRLEPGRFVSDGAGQAPRR